MRPAQSWPLLAALLIALAAAAPVPRPGATATCSLVMRGGGAQNAAPTKPPSLRLACSGGPVLAAVNAGALGLSPNAAFPGVTLDPSGCNGAAAACLVTLCGGAARVTIRDAVIADVASAGSNASTHALCVRGAAHVTLVGGTFTGNRNVSALAVNDTATLDISGGTVFADNEGMAAPLVAGGNATLIVAGGARFTGNFGGDRASQTLAGCGSAVTIAGRAAASLSGPITFSNNTGHGGAVCIGGGRRDAPRVTIRGPRCTFERNLGYDAAAIKVNASPFLNASTEVDDCSFVGNAAHPSATYPGATIFAKDYGALRLRDVLFADNASPLEGDAAPIILMTTPLLAAPAGLRLAPQLATIGGARRCEFRSNAGSAAGVLYVAGSVLFDGPCTFDGNRAVRMAGAIQAVMGSGNIAATARLAFKNNAADGNSTGLPVYQQACGGAVALSRARASFLGGVDAVNNSVGAKGSGGAFCVDTYSSLVIDGPRSLIANNRARGRGGAVFLDRGSSLQLSNADVDGNQALAGAGIGLQSDSNASLADCSIASNVAQTLGGGVAVNNRARLNVTDCTVINNTALSGEGGGILAQGRSAVRLAGVTFGGNRALTGGDLAVALTVNMTLLPGTNVGPGNSTVLWARTDCLVGEVLSEGGYCVRCGANLYSVLPNATACQLCPARAACPGGDVIEPLRGSWHSHPYSALVHECPNRAACSCAPEQDAPGACSGSPCAEGYTGNVCGACAKGYIPTGQFKCGKCMPPAVVATLYLLSILAVLRLMAYSAANNWADNLDFARKAAAASAADAAAPSKAASEGPPPQLPPPPAAKLKLGEVIMVFILFIQYLGIVSSLPAPWPASFRALLLGTGWVFASASGSTLSVDCLLHGRTSLPLAVARPLAHLLVQLGMAALLVAAFLVPWRRLSPCWAGVNAACFEVSAVKRFFGRCCGGGGGKTPSAPDGGAAAAAAARAAAAAAEAGEAPGVFVNGAHAATAVQRGRPSRGGGGAAAAGSSSGSSDGGVRAGGGEGGNGSHNLPLDGGGSKGLLPAVVALTAVFYFYSSFLKIGLSFFACVNLDRASANDPFATATAPHGYWANDIQQPCWQGWHRAWALALGLPLVLVFCVGVPVGVAVTLWVRRRELDAPRTRLVLGTLYMPWRPGCYWYYAVIYAQMVVLTSIAVFRHSVGPLYASQLFAAATLVMLCLHLLLREQRGAAFNHLFTAKLAVLAFVAWAGLVLQAASTREAAAAAALLGGGGGGGGGGGVSAEAIAEGIGAAALAASAGFILLCIGLFAKIARDEAKAAAKRAGKAWFVSVAGNVSGSAFKL